MTVSAGRGTRSVVVAPRRAPKAAETPLRLIRRGRAAVVVALLAAIVTVLMTAGPSTQASSRVVHARPATVTVETGETLWQLASRVAPHADPRLVVTEIERLNHLSGPVVYAGQQLVVPRYR